MSTEQNNRDCNRQNKANTAVKATIYSEITNDAIKRVEDILLHMTSNFNQLDTGLIQSNLGHIAKLIKICKEGNILSQKLYVKCSTYVKTTAVEIAHKENSYVKRAIKFKETSDLETVMFHYHPDMLRMYNIILDKVSLPDMSQYVDSDSDMDSKSQGSYDQESILTTPPITTPTRNSSIDNTLPIAITPTSPYVEMNRFNTIASQSLQDNLCSPTISRTLLRDYGLPSTCQHPTESPMSIASYIPYFKLPPPVESSEWFTPLQAILSIIRFSDCRIKYICDLPLRPIDNKLQKKKVNNNLIIDIMIMKGYVPVNKTTMYGLLNEYRKEGKLKYSMWRDKNKTGPKPMLERGDINRIINHFKDITDGGRCSSSDDLESSITEAIQKDLAANNCYSKKRESIPETTMNRYVKGIMSIYEYNIQERVSNKTESRSAAEFSVRSTISYMMVVLTTHFINAPPSKFHTKVKELENNPLYTLIRKLNKEVLGSVLTDDELNQLIYILPNLITSTDECSLFITNQKIRNKVSWYFCLRPTSKNKPNVDSNRRDNYTTTQVGDAHLRGLRISLNNTFSAGGRCAPIFACVFGLKLSEMPKDDIVICKVKGLIASAETSGTNKEGFIVFIRGKYETNDDIEDNNDNNTNTPCTESSIDTSNINIQSSTQADTYRSSGMSKESRVAKIYRELVYYPFIQGIRVDDYDMDPDSTEIPTNLTAVSWMDGCHGQLKLTTTETVLKKEEKLNIITCKHSAARTSVEQASDVGPMFKNMKAAVKKMPPTNSGSSPLFF